MKHPVMEVIVKPSSIHALLKYSEQIQDRDVVNQKVNQWWY